MPGVTELMKARYPSIFAEAASGFKLDSWQITALDFLGKRLLMVCSRQSGKTFVASVLALHEAVYNKGALVLIVSYNLDQAMELVRRIVEISQWLSLPPMLGLNKKSLELANGSRILSLSATEGAVRSWTPTLVIVDEASRCAELTYLSLRPVMAVTDARLILLSSPNGTAGFFWRAYAKPVEKWVVAEVTAEQCPRISAEFLEAEYKILGERLYKQEYQNMFLAPAGSMFSADVLRKALSADVKPYIDKSTMLDSTVKPYSYSEGR